MEKINTLKDFIAVATTMEKYDIWDNCDIANMFEDSCTDELRGKILGLSDATSPEPFRSAMYFLGFTNY